MIISVEDLKKYVTTSESDEMLEARLLAIESMIRNETNNNFQLRNIRFMGHVMATRLYCPNNLFSVGDTIQISGAAYADGLYVIAAKEDGFLDVGKTFLDEANFTITKVEYPSDIKMGVVNLIKWDLENRKKVGIASETISRHSVSYFNMDGDNSLLGYPKSLMGFIKPYKKARF